MSGASSKCLGKGSPPPGPVPEGQIRVYSMRFCPFAQRTLMVLKAKGIRHEIININLKNKPEWFFKKNPSGLVPVLEDSQGRLISDSMIICEYLDEAYPEKKLFPDDPYKKACQKMNLELFSKGKGQPLYHKLLDPELQLITTEICSALLEELVIYTLGNLEMRHKLRQLYVPPLVSSFIREKKKENHPDLKEELSKELRKLEEAMTPFNSDFFGGDTVSMADYLMWPWFQRLEALELNECVANTPKLKLWMAAMQEDPTASSHSIDPKVFRGFISLYLQDSHEACDYGL